MTFAWGIPLGYFSQHGRPFIVDRPMYRLHVFDWHLLIIRLSFT